MRTHDLTKSRDTDNENLRKEEDYKRFVLFNKSMLLIQLFYK